MGLNPPITVDNSDKYSTVPQSVHALRLTYQFADRALEVRRTVMDDATHTEASGSGELVGQRVVVSVDGVIAWNGNSPAVAYRTDATAGTYGSVAWSHRRRSKVTPRRGPLALR